MKVLTPEFSHKDARRNLFQLFTADIKQVNFYEAKKKAILGNHYHKETVEYFYVTKGTLIFNDERVFNKGDIFAVYPEEKHKIEVFSEEASFMTFLTKPFDKEKPDLYA